MGAIRTSIVVNDGMSSALRSMNKALNIVLSSYSSLQEVSGNPVETASIQAAREALTATGVQIDSIEEEIQKAAAAQEDFTDKVQQTQRASNGLLTSVTRMLAAYATAQTVQKALDTADAWSQTSARLNMVAREGENVDEIQEKIFASANRSRAAYMDTADIVAKMGLRAGSAFGSTDEIIAFTETLNKMYAVAGASQEEQASSMLQLTQALGSGVLRGEEFNAVFEAAPNIMQAVADYMEVPLGKLRELSAEGQITASIVKNAMLDAAEDVNAQFESMPATFSQAWNLFSNQAMMALEPVWVELGRISSSDDFLNFATASGQALAAFAGAAVSVLEMVARAASFVGDNWSVIGPIVYGVAAAFALYTAAMVAHNGVLAVSNGLKAAAALRESIHAAKLALSTNATFTATAAQYGLNAALLACPLTIILLAIIAVIAALYAVVGAINNTTDSTYSATGIIMGLLSVAVAFIMNLLLALVEIAFSVVNGMVNPFVAYANFLANVFVDPIGAIIHLFGDMADTVLAILEKIASAIDIVFGSNLAGAVSNWRGTLSAKVEGAAEKYGNGKYQKVADKLDLSVAGTGMERFDYGSAWDTGYAKGEELGDKLSGLFPGNKGVGTGGYEDLLGSIDTGVGETASNTGKSLDISEENLRYMRDIAERDAINRFTTAEIKVDMVNNNSVSSNLDLDGVVHYMASGVQTAMEQAAEGVHT
ncbi:MAG: tape measure protein [Eubacteriales bacterium]|nr:tape measure protein [Eubacteriales bacterium]